MSILYVDNLCINSRKRVFFSSYPLYVVDKSVFIHTQIVRQFTPHKRTIIVSNVYTIVTVY